jgi:hypothetical protein
MQNERNESRTGGQETRGPASTSESPVWQNEKWSAEQPGGFSPVHRSEPDIWKRMRHHAHHRQRFFGPIRVM